MNVTTVWQEFLAIVTEEVGSRVVETWFKTVSISAWDGATKTVYLKAPNSFIKEWVMSQYSELIRTHLRRLLNETQIRLLFLDESKVEVSCAVESDKGTIMPATQTAFQTTGSKKNKTPAAISTRYQFDSFVVGPHNALAFAAAKAVAEQPGTLYNPLCIYGGSGLGKTHLLAAVGNQIRAQNPKARIIYQSADRFVHEFITAVRFDKGAAFEQRYRDIDVLLIDDIQCIARKEQTQEAFFHIFNALYESRKQIVFSCDSVPSAIEGLAERLRSRLAGALITDIQPPCIETKIAILQKKADLQKEKLLDDVAQYIASRVSTNVRELEGLLIRVLAFATLTHQAVSLELAHRVLNPTAIETTRRAPLDLPTIAQKVAKQYNYSMVELRSTKRHKNLALARHIAMYLMKKETGRSLIDIAAFWCRKDHSTVIHALDKIDQMRARDARFNEELSRLEMSIKQ